MSDNPDLDAWIAEESARINAHHGMTSSNGLPVAPAARPSAEQHGGQLRMAYRLAVAYDRRLMFVHGVGWHNWDGRRWIEDQRGEAKCAVLDILRQALAESLGDKELRADVRKCESAAGIAGVLDIASALKPFAFTVRDLDPDPYLLNVANGTLDLRTMQLSAHNPADRLTKVTTAAWNPGAQGEVWPTFLARVLPDADVRDFLGRYVGQALTGHVLVLQP